MMDRKQKLWLSSLAGAALVAGILVLVNILSYYGYVRVDLSSGRVYSVSAASKRILKRLPDNVLVNVYYSKELPAQVAVYKNYLRDLLKEYVSGSGGKVRTRFIEIGEDPKFRDEAVKNGIQPVRFDIISKEKYQQQEGFLGLTIQYQDKKEVVGFLQDVNGLEYDLTSKIKTMSMPKKPVLGFMSGHEAVTLDVLEPQVAEALRARYEIQSVDLASLSVSSGVPKEVGSLVLAGPQDRLTEKELFFLDRYLVSGHNLLILADTKKVDTQSFFARDIDTGLLPWLAHHGFKVNPSLVFDAQSQVIQVSVQRGPFMMANIVQYPPLVMASNLGESHPITKGLDSITLPFVSAMEVTTQSGQGRVDILARSSKYSWMKTPGGAAPQMLNPLQFPPPSPEDPKGPFVLAATKQGRFEPYFQTPPAGLTGKEIPAEPAAPGRLVVMGTSKILNREYRLGGANQQFFLNTVDWLSQEADLIAIRSKSVTFHPLREVPAKVKTFVRYANMFLPPLLAILLGMWRWRRMRRYRDERRALYGFERVVTPPAAA